MSAKLSDFFQLSLRALTFKVGLVIAKNEFGVFSGIEKWKLQLRIKSKNQDKTLKHMFHFQAKRNARRPG